MSYLHRLPSSTWRTTPPSFIRRHTSIHSEANMSRATKRTEMNKNIFHQGISSLEDKTEDAPSRLNDIQLKIKALERSLSGLNVTFVRPRRHHNETFLTEYVTFCSNYGKLKMPILLEAKTLNTSNVGGMIA